VSVPSPIFDLEQPPPQQRWGWLPKLIGGALGAIFSALLILADQNELPDWHWPACNGLLVLPALYFVIAIHELGHLAAGRLAGLNTGGIAVGGFIFTKSGKNWAFRFNRRLLGGGFFKPLTGTAGFRASRYAWMVAAGPAVSLFVMVVCGWVSVQYGSGHWNWIGTVFWTSPVGVISLVPFSSGLNKSDGMLLRMLIRHPEHSRSWMALIALQTEEARGLRPRDPRLVEHMLAVDIRSSDYVRCQLMAYYLRVDQGQEVAALEHLENALAGSGHSGIAIRHALYLEAASASAGISKHAAQARVWLQRARKLRRPDSLDVVEAGIAMCEGRYEEAAGHWEAARARVLRRRLDSGCIRLALEKWAEQEAVCRLQSGLGGD
jgi:peptidase M50-like protein